MHGSRHEGRTIAYAIDQGPAVIEMLCLQILFFHKERIYSVISLLGEHCQETDAALLLDAVVVVLATVLVLAAAIIL